MFCDVLSWSLYGTFFYSSNITHVNFQSWDFQSISIYCTNWHLDARLFWALMILFMTIHVHPSLITHQLGVLWLNIQYEAYRLEDFDAREEDSDLMLSIFNHFMSPHLSNTNFHAVRRYCKVIQEHEIYNFFWL